MSWIRMWICGSVLHVQVHSMRFMPLGSGSVVGVVRQHTFCCRWQGTRRCF